MSEPPFVSTRPIAGRNTKGQITLDSLAQRPLCPRCAITMFLARSQPGRSSCIIRCTFECPVCDETEIILLKPHAMMRLDEANQPPPDMPIRT